jgi:hypothetical protein
MAKIKTKTGPREKMGKERERMEKDRIKWSKRPPLKEAARRPKSRPTKRERKTEEVAMIKVGGRCCQKRSKTFFCPKRDWPKFPFKILKK